MAIIKLNTETDFTTSALARFLNKKHGGKVTGKEFTIQDIQQYEYRGIPNVYGGQSIERIELENNGIKLLRLIKPSSNSDQKTKEDYSNRMTEIYDELKKNGQSFPRIKGMYNRYEHSYYNVAKRLFLNASKTKGIKKLSKDGNHKFTFEYVALSNEYKHLFTEEELEICKKKLRVDE